MWNKRKSIKAMDHAKGHIQNVRKNISNGNINDVDADLGIAEGLLERAIQEEKNKIRECDSKPGGCTKL